MHGARLARRPWADLACPGILIDMDLDLGRWLIVGVGASLLMLGLRTWLPKAAGRRVAEKGSIIGPATRPTFEEQALKRTGAELQNLANRKLHDDMLAEAVKLKLRARTGIEEERLNTLDRAFEKTKDALTARAESYEGIKLLAELHLDRALITQDPLSVADLERAAQGFAKASSFRLGVIDNYVGRGWSYLQMTNVDPEFSHIYAEKAAVAFAAGFERAQMNVWIMRGWGLALDRFARADHHDRKRFGELEAEFRAALARHRDGQHDLFDWYAAIRRADQPEWIDVPPVRDVY